MNQLIDARQAATLLGISLRRAYSLVRRGLLPVIRFGPKQLRFSVAALEAWIAAGGRVGRGEDRQGSTHNVSPKSEAPE